MLNSGLPVECALNPVGGELDANQQDEWHDNDVEIRDHIDDTLRKT